MNALWRCTACGFGGSNDIPEERMRDEIRARHGEDFPYCHDRYAGQLPVSVWTGDEAVKFALDPREDGELSCGAEETGNGGVLDEN